MGKRKGLKKILKRASLSPTRKTTTTNKEDDKKKKKQQPPPSSKAEEKEEKKQQLPSSKAEAVEEEDFRDDVVVAATAAPPAVHNDDDTASVESEESDEKETDLFEAQELPAISAGNKLVCEEKVKSIPDDNLRPSPAAENPAGNTISFDTYREQPAPSIPVGCSLLFVAIARHEPDVEFHIISRYCETTASFDEADYMTYAYEHLGEIDDENYSSIFASPHGNWFVKSDNGFVYIVVATTNYPRYFAVEIVDSLSNIITIGRDEYKRQMEEGRHDTKYDKPSFIHNISEWKHGLGRKATSTVNDKKRANEKGELTDYGEIVPSEDTNAKKHIAKRHGMKKELNDYCEIIYKEYKDLQEGSKAYQLHQEIDSVKDQMAQNIDVLLQNIDTLESMEETCDNLLEASKVFKKEASDLQRKMWLKDKSFLILGAGTASAVAIGATAGFLAGGPGGAAIVALPSVAAAEAIEASVLAGACGVAYYATAKAAMHTWFWSKKFRKVK